MSERGDALRGVASDTHGRTTHTDAALYSLSQALGALVLESAAAVCDAIDDHTAALRELTEKLPSKRELAAMMALGGLVAQSPVRKPANVFAGEAQLVADALLAALGGEKS